MARRAGSYDAFKAEVRRGFNTTTVRDQSPRAHHKGATGRVRTGDQRYPALCHCQLEHDVPTHVLSEGTASLSPRRRTAVAAAEVFLQLRCAVTLTLASLVGSLIPVRCLQSESESSGSGPARREHHHDARSRSVTNTFV